jgi:hypothetical protein
VYYYREVKEIVTDFNTAHKQNLLPNTPLTTRLYNKPKIHYISATANDAITTTASATTISAAAATTTTTTTTTIMSIQHRKRQQDATYETEPETTSKCTWQTIKKRRETAQPQKTELNSFNLTVTTGTNNSHNYQMPIMTISCSQTRQTTPNLPRKTVDNGTLSLPQYSYTE